MRSGLEALFPSKSEEARRITLEDLQVDTAHIAEVEENAEELEEGAGEVGSSSVEGMELAADIPCSPVICSHGYNYGICGILAVLTGIVDIVDIVAEA